MELVLEGVEEKNTESTLIPGPGRSRYSRMNSKQIPHCEPVLWVMFWQSLRANLNLPC